MISTLMKPDISPKSNLHVLRTEIVSDCSLEIWTLEVSTEHVTSVQRIGLLEFPSEKTALFVQKLYFLR